MSKNENSVAKTKNLIQITITPRDPLILRDGRPFGAGSEGANRARSLDWFYPSTVAGAVRTLTGKLKAERNSVDKKTSNPFHNVGFLDRLKKIVVRGPLPLIDGMLYVPRPLDFLEYESGRRVGLRPGVLLEGEGCDLPHPDLRPIDVPLTGKAAQMSSFWSMETIADWLAQDVKKGFPLGQILNGFEKDKRVHVKMKAAAGISDESQLFITQGLAIPDISFQPKNIASRPRECPTLKSTHIALLIKAPDTGMESLLSTVDTLQPLGGERRLARFRSHNPVTSWDCPVEIQEALKRTTGIRMFLATPAFFQNGWFPDWIDSKTLEGTPPGTRGLLLRLCSGCVGRWKALSGWSMEKGKRGPKPVKRLAPAGSVYFFEVLEGAAEALADLWLRSAMNKNNSQDDTSNHNEVNDGFGLALWGVWNIDA